MELESFVAVTGVVATPSNTNRPFVVLPAGKRWCEIGKGMELALGNSDLAYPGIMYLGSGADQQNL